MLKFIALTLLFALPASAANKPGCDLRFKKEKLCASLVWKKKPVLVEAPTEKDQAEFQLKFWDPKTASASGPFTAPQGDLSVIVSMPEMDHGSEPTTVQPGATGTFDVGHIFFTMGGGWEIRVTLKKDGKTLDVAKMGYTLK